MRGFVCGLGWVGVLLPALAYGQPEGPLPDAFGSIINAVDEVVSIDPTTGAVTGTVSVMLTTGPKRAEGVLELWIDAGLRYERVWLDSGEELPFSNDGVEDGFRRVWWRTTTVPEGTQVTFHIRYGGTLVCPEDPSRHDLECDTGGSRFDFAGKGTAFALVSDPLSRPLLSVPRYPRRLRLSVPLGVQAFVSADWVRAFVENGRQVTEWVVPRHHALSGSAYLAVFGDLVEREVPGTRVPTFVIHRRDHDQGLTEFMTWTRRILGYLDVQADRPLPYPRINIVKMPQNARLRGALGHGMAFFPDSPPEDGARRFEERLAHEISHFWWGELANDFHINTEFLAEASRPSRRLTTRGLFSRLRKVEMFIWAGGTTNSRTCSITPRPLRSCRRLCPHPTTLNRRMVVRGVTGRITKAQPS